MAFPWLINGGDPNYLLSGMILQVREVSSKMALISGKDYYNKIAQIFWGDFWG